MRTQLNAVLGDRYAVKRELGRGGMASVWLARDLRHDRDIAIKVLHPELAGAIGVDRFVREIRLTAGLQHPSILPLLDSGVFESTDGDKLAWYAMPYVAGESLRARIDRERQLSIDEALRITEAAGAALQAAHRTGIVHRDVKPENLLLAGEYVYVADFGIAKALIDTGGERLTSTGIVIGTPAYMSPEQASADVVDARSDQYSLASVLYEMLAGEPPFTGPSARAIVGRRLAEAPRAIRPVRPAVSRALEAVVLKALERVPADRFTDVDAFVAALRSAHTRGEASSQAGMRRTRLVAASLAAVVLIGAVASAPFVIGRRPSAGRAPRNPDAIALYQRGQLSYAKRTPDGARDAIASFKGALERDSTYGEAWSALAEAYEQAYVRRYVFSGAVGDSILRLAAAASDRALALDRMSADAWYTQAMVARHVDPTDVAPVIRSARRAISLDSSHAAAWRLLALMTYEAGDRDESLRDFRRAISADPSYTEGLAFFALAFYWAHQYDSAAFWIDSTLKVDPNYLLGRHTAGLIALEQGDVARAEAAFQAAFRLATDVEAPNALIGSSINAARAGRRAEAKRYLARAESLNTAYVPIPLHNQLYTSQAYAALGDRDRAIALLRQHQSLEEMHFQLHLRCDPPFAPLERDPRFRALLLKPRPSRGC